MSATTKPDHDMGYVEAGRSDATEDRRDITIGGWRYYSQGMGIALPV